MTVPTVPVSYDELTDAERAWMVNGCGPGTGFWQRMVPEMVWHEACNRHDFHYWLGFREQDRYLADRRFLRNMLEAANKAAGTGWWSGFRRAYYKAWAWRYYWAVRLLGGPTFTRRERYATRDDLEREMAAGPRQ